MTNFYIASKFLIKNLIQTLITIFIVTVGTAIFYFVFNASASLKMLVLTTTAEANSHIYFTGDFNFTSYDDEEVNNFRESIFKKDRRVVAVNYSQYLNGTVLNSENKLSPLVLKGLDFEHGYLIQNIGFRVEEEDINEFPESGEFEGYYGEVVIGDKLAKELGYSDYLDAVGNTFNYNYNGEVYPLKIVAAFYSDLIDISLHTIYTTLDVTMTLSNNFTTANAVEIKIKKPLKSEQVLNNIKDTILEVYPTAAIVEWQEGNKYAVNALYIEDVSIFIIQLFTALAIAFGINSLILFNIRQKINQVGILMAMGSNKKDITLIFFYQMLIIVTSGIILGVFLGHTLSLTFMKLFKRPSSDHPLVTLFDSIFNIYTLITVGVIFTSSIIFSFIPIRYAQRLKIVEVIKNE